MRISVIGTGLMGSAIAEGLLAAGFTVVIHNRTREKTRPLEALGAKVADSPAKAIRSSDATVLALIDAASTREFIRSEQVTAALSRHALLNVAATTPEEIGDLARFVDEAGGNLAEVNVTNYPDLVRQRHGEFILACDQAHTMLWRTILGALGEKVHHVGSVGSASKAEMALWLSYLFHTIAVGYSVAAFAKQDLPINVARLILTENPVLRIAGAEKLIAAMKDRAYGTKLWSVDNMVSSCDLVIGFAQHLGLPTEVFAAIRELYVAAAASGYGDKDITAVYEAIYAER